METDDLTVRNELQESSKAKHRAGRTWRGRLVLSDLRET